MMIIILITLLFTNPVMAVQEKKVPTGNLEVVVVGMKSDEGQVRIGLYNTEESYRSRGDLPAFMRAKVKVQGHKAVYVFKDVPYGEYTIKLFYDINNNDKLDKNFLGIPNEPYAFSNNARGIALPSYDKAKFFVDAQELSMEIKCKE